MIPKPLFFLSARLFGEACLELYICRVTPEGKEEVYLLPRPKNDPFYPSMLHMPGVRKIPSETDYQHFMRAIGETIFINRITRQSYVMSNTFKTPRGTEFADVRKIEVSYYRDDPDFYDVENIPSNTIEHHKVIIRMVKK